MRSKKILVVDDDRSIQQMIRVCLEELGCVLEQAADGAQALEAIHRAPPDVVLLDLAMPVIDGMTVLADLRTLLPDSTMKVVVMTAHGSVRAAIQAVRLGAADFLEKPFKPEELRQCVASALSDALPGGVDPNVGYGAALQSVRDALRRGKFIAAEAALMKAGTISDSDPCFMNLAGVLHEAHGRQASARNFYQKALKVDPHYTPAHRNLARLDQFERTGSTRAEVDLGDEPYLADAESPPSSPADRFGRMLLAGRKNSESVNVR